MTYLSFADFHEAEGITNGVSPHGGVFDGCRVTYVKEHSPVNRLHYLIMTTMMRPINYFYKYTLI